MSRYFDRKQSVLRLPFEGEEFLVVFQAISKNQLFDWTLSLRCLEALPKGRSRSVPEGFSVDF